MAQAGDKIYIKSISIHASTSKVWEALTEPELMKRWMSEWEMNVHTDWMVGNSFDISGDLHGIKFENKGKVLRFEKERVLAYSHLSSISELPDKIENYTILQFKLT